MLQISGIHILRFKEKNLHCFQHDNLKWIYCVSAFSLLLYVIYGKLFSLINTLVRKIWFPNENCKQTILQKIKMSL